MNATTVWLSCGVLQAELEELLRLGKIRGELLFLDSMLHMVPEQLEATMTVALEAALGWSHFSSWRKWDCPA